MGKNQTMELVNAHMAGQSNAGCKHASWSEAYAYASGVMKGHNKLLPLEEMMKQKISERQTKVLEFFYLHFNNGEIIYRFNDVCDWWPGLNEKQVRVAVRALKRKGFLSYSVAVSLHEDGEVAGSGHYCNRQGAAYFEKLFPPKK